MKILITGLAIIISNVYATTFYPVPLKEQIKSSQAIVQGIIISRNIIENEDFGLVTEVYIKPIKYQADQALKEESLRVIYPGGTLSGNVVEIQGTPQMALGEQVVLLLSKHQGSYWVNNLGMGKYTVKNIGDKKVIVNQIFPEHPEIGHLSLKRFFKLVEFVKDQKVVDINKTRFEIEDEKKRKRYLKLAGRKIASENIVEQKEKFPLIWLVIILGSLGFLFRLIKNKKS